YSQIHNEGGNISVPVTKKMRKFAWAKHYEQAGKGSKEFTPWKGLALTKKNGLNITIPKRQFMGNSRDLNEIIAKDVTSYIKNIFK
ncbi:hypothetical protein KAU11_04980, partial [Candidatus Babeliales bacterium]|nr:hypothetical protein [Candidatus Babeliales bacterium]